MNTEYEATFIDIDKNQTRERLRVAGAKLLKSEFLQKRINFDFPESARQETGWIRVRDEQDKITLSIKKVSGNTIEGQQENEIKVDSFDKATSFLDELGCRRKAYQETKRERWELNGVEVVIDEWPFLEPFVEIEGKNEAEVKRTAERLGFEWEDALFCAVGTIYEMKYGVPKYEVNNNIPRLIFDMANPFK